MASKEKPAGGSFVESTQKQPADTFRQTAMEMLSAGCFRECGHHFRQREQIYEAMVFFAKAHEAYTRGKDPAATKLLDVGVEGILKERSRDELIPVYRRLCAEPQSLDKAYWEVVDKEGLRGYLDIEPMEKRKR